jgi:hypothetical protein
MNLNRCIRLEEVQRALSQGHWPQACADLQVHVQSCARCTEEVLVTKHFQALRTQSIATAEPGSVSLLYWKSQARRRSALLQQMERPLLAGQLVALVIVLLIIASIVTLHGSGTWANGMQIGSAAAPSNAWSWLLDAWGLLPVLTGAGMVVLLTGIILYLALPLRPRNQHGTQNG